MIINGRLVKNITFKTLKERDCHGDLNRVCGDVRHCTVEIPFHLFVEVKGARDGDLCEVEDAIVAGEFDKLIDKNDDGTFNKLLERSVHERQHICHMLSAIMERTARREALVQWPNTVRNRSAPSGSRSTFGGLQRSREKARR